MTSEPRMFIRCGAADFDASEMVALVDEAGFTSVILRNGKSFLVAEGRDELNDLINTAYQTAADIFR